MTKLEFIHTIRQLIADGKSDDALALMRAQISNYDSSLLTDATLLESRYTNIFTDFAIKGIVPREDYDRSVAQINYAVLEIIEKLEKSVPLSTSAAKNKNSGRILHNIPGTMPVGKERRCIVRIAYDDETLLRDLTVDENTTIQSVRIAEVMGVELIDFNETPAFSIRTVTEEEQFISAEDYTQWLFMVKALREGKFPLTLKVAVIEEVNGKERKRDIVLEKEVFIISQIEEPTAAAIPAATTQDMPQQSAPMRFEDSTIRLNYVVTEEDRAAAPTSQSSKRFSFSGIASTIAIIAVALTGWVAFQTFNTSPMPLPSPPPPPPPPPIHELNGDTSVKLAEQNILRDSLSNNTNPTNESAIPETDTKSGNNPSKTDVSNANVGKPSSIAANTQNNINSKKTTNQGKTGATAAKKNTATKPKTSPKTPVPSKPTTPPQIIIGDLNVTTTAPPTTDTNVKTEPEAPVKIFKVHLILKGEMKKAEISVDGQSVDKYLKKNIWGTPQYIEFKSNKERHTITFKRGKVSCSITDVLIENGNMTVEPCSF